VRWIVNEDNEQENTLLADEGMKLAKRMDPET
jgi:hypothetical protein